MGRVRGLDGKPEAANGDVPYVPYFVKTVII